MKETNDQDSWSEIRIKLKSRFNKMSEAEVEKLKIELHQVKEKLQKLYSFAQAKAEKEYDELMSNLGHHQAKQSDAPIEVSLAPKVETENSSPTHNEVISSRY